LEAGRVAAQASAKRRLDAADPAAEKPKAPVAAAESSSDSDSSSSEEDEDTAPSPPTLSRGRGTPCAPLPPPANAPPPAVTNDEGPAFRRGGHAYEPRLAPSPAPALPTSDTVPVADGEAVAAGEVVEFKLATWGENWTPALSPPRRARVARVAGGTVTLAEEGGGTPLEIPQNELRELRRVVFAGVPKAAPAATPIAGRTRGRSASDAAAPEPKRRAPPTRSTASTAPAPTVSKVRKGSKSSRKRPAAMAGPEPKRRAPPTRSTVPLARCGTDNSVDLDAPAPAPTVAAASPKPKRRGRPRKKKEGEVAAAPAPAAAAPEPAEVETKAPGSAKKRCRSRKNGPTTPGPFSPTLPQAGIDASLLKRRSAMLELAK